MKTLIVYYSRSGVTKTVAEALKQSLSADIEEIHDTKDRVGVLGWMSAGKDATLKRATPIEATKLSPGDYDLVIVGTPVWAFTMASPVRTWLTQHGREIKKAAFFCTMGGSGDKRSFTEMEQLCGRPPAGVAAFIDKTVRKGAHVEQLTAFVESLI